MLRLSSSGSKFQGPGPLPPPLMMLMINSSFVPQVLQKRWPSTASVPHLGQNISASRVSDSTTQYAKYSARVYLSSNLSSRSSGNHDHAAGEKYNRMSAYRARLAHGLDRFRLPPLESLIATAATDRRSAARRLLERSRAQGRRRSQ